VAADAADVDAADVDPAGAEVTDADATTAGAIVPTEVIAPLMNTASATAVRRRRRVDREAVEVVIVR
jgi:hypothetical protein